MSDPRWQDELTPIVRQLQIIVGALTAGCVTFLIIALLVTGGKAVEGETPMVTCVAVAFAVMALITRMVVAGIMVSHGRRTILQTSRRSPQDQGLQPADANSPKRTADARKLFPLLINSTIVSAALLEGAAFFALIAYILEQSPLSLIVAIVLIVGLAFYMPTRSRAVHWIEDQLRLLQEERQLGR